MKDLRGHRTLVHYYGRLGNSSNYNKKNQDNEKRNFNAELEPQMTPKLAKYHMPPSVSIIADPHTERPTEKIEMKIVFFPGESLRGVTPRLR